MKNTGLTILAILITSSYLFSQEVFIGANISTSSPFYVSYDEINEQDLEGKGEIDLGVIGSLKFGKLMLNSNISFFINDIGVSSMSFSPGIKFGWYELSAGFTYKIFRTQIFDYNTFDYVSSNDKRMSTGFNLSHSFHFNQAYRLNLTSDIFPNVETEYDDEIPVRFGIGFSVNISAFQ